MELEEEIFERLGLGRQVLYNYRYEDSGRKETSQDISPSPSPFIVFENISTAILEIHFSLPNYASLRVTSL